MKEATMTLLLTLFPLGLGLLVLQLPRPHKP
jgi:hypothetical protein